jgi:hypothetical protein
VPPAASRSNRCIDPWPLAPARGGRGGGEVAAGKKTVAPWGRRRPAGVREPATAGPPCFFRAPRGQGEMGRDGARARPARGRRRRRPKLDLPKAAAAADLGSASPAALDAPRVAGSGLGEGEGGPTTGKEAAWSTSSTVGTPLLCSAPAPREDEAPLPLPPPCSPWRTRPLQGAPGSPPRLGSSAPLPPPRSRGRVGRRATAPSAGEGDGGGHAVAARGRALLAGSVAGRLLAKSRRGGERERGGQRLGCSVPKDARVGGIVAFCSMLCGSRWSRYSTARVCKTQMQHQLQHLLEMVLAGCDSS